MNIVSVVDKYFLDTLTGSGVIIDDDYLHVEYEKIHAIKTEGEGNKKIHIFCTFL